MNKAMMKWIISQLEDRVLLDWARGNAIKIKGVRDIAQLHKKSNFKSFRPQIINELSRITNPESIYDCLREYIEPIINEEQRAALLHIPEEQLLADIEAHKYQLSDALVALIVQRDEGMNRAEQLYTALVETDRLRSYEGIVYVEQEQTVNSELLRKDDYIRSLEEQLDQANSQCQELQNMIDELRMRRKTEVQEWKRERKAYIEEIRHLNNDIEHRNKLLIHRNERIQALVDYNDEYALHASTMNINENKQVQPSVPAQAKRRPSVILIGDLIDNNVTHTAKYEIKQIASTQIGDFIQQSAEADDVDEVWMLAFQLSPQKQRKLRNYVEQGKLVSFANVIELRTYINKK